MIKVSAIVWMTFMTSTGQVTEPVAIIKPARNSEEVVVMPIWSGTQPTRCPNQDIAEGDPFRF